MTIICIHHVTNGAEFVSGCTLADAAQKALEARVGVGAVTAVSVIPLGGTHSHAIYRDIDPEGFWLAQLAHNMTDNEYYGWGATEAEALAHARPELDEV